MNHSQAITIYQPMLQSIAQRMLGSIADAEDIVQDTLLKWLTIDTEKIKNTKAYLIKSVTNNCINHLNTIKRKKDECLESINPKEFIDKYREKELFHFDFENEMSSALNVIHKKLEPLEKSIYVLREFFDVEYDELQVLFNKKKDNCRKLFSRAKDKLNQETTKVKGEISNTTFFERFKNACHLENPAELIQHFIEELQTKPEKK
ncbi:sigma-70 family RNA polymerase sigma factor [Fulvivirga lutimaris]|uniref:sigma-70 family RNA polymerase sigma factor n=1 Tax=Fulvivirga lutimaris TaxID=1819566 RepID=UPI0012BC32E1|nr:sigma-70 family RNA polymerase sigma factor [Fulvivirga lutimaris]MTI40531.1 sigma-70 family RNA polymerase sigma factor [Fulvivirga lutimaris]